MGSNPRLMDLGPEDLVEAARLSGVRDERVLATATQTALLAELAACVWSVERWPDLAEVARENLVRRGTVTGAHFVRLYGRHGFEDG